MTISCEAFKAAHLSEIDTQPWQRHVFARAIEAGTFVPPAALEEAGNAYTLRHRGRIVACAGLVASDTAAVHLWAVVADRAPLVILHRAARRLLEIYRGCGRISATTEANFAQGCRWLDLLGFERREVLTGYGVGIDQVLYTRDL
jgi:hypothetical protein